MKKLFLLKISIFMAVVFVSYSTMAQTAGTLTFNFTEVAKANSVTYQSQGRHIIVVWIENNNGTFVKTLLKNGGSTQGSTEDHLPTWSVNAGGTQNNCTNANSTGASSSSPTVQSVSGATLTSFTNRLTSWNGKDVTGNVVADGSYKVFIEETWSHSGTVVRSFNFTKGSSADVQSPTADANFSNISLAWNPASSGIEENSVNTGVKIYPNPSADGIFNVEFTKANEISVIDAAGTTIYQTTVDANATTKAINLSQFSNGVYFINVVDGDHSSQQKVVLEK